MQSGSERKSGSSAACKIATRVAAGFAALLLIMLAFHVLTEFQRARRANAAVDTIALTNVLLDDLARERSEAIYLAVSPDAGTADFAERAGATDGTLAALGRSPLFKPGILSRRQQAVAQQAVAAIGELPALRAQVMARETGTIEIAQAYTELTDTVIGAMGDVFDEMSPGLSAFSVEYEALARLLDRANLEVGVVYAGFALADMPAPLHAVLTEAIAGQEAAKDAFREAAGPSRGLDLDALLGLTEGLELHQVRANMHAASRTGSPDPALRALWSEIMPARIADLVLERNRFARENLEALAAASHARLRQAVLREVVALAVLGLSFIVVRGGVAMIARRRRTRRTPVLPAN